MTSTWMQPWTTKVHMNVYKKFMGAAITTMCHCILNGEIYKSSVSNYFQVLRPHKNNLMEYYRPLPPTPHPPQPNIPPRLSFSRKFSNPTIVRLDKGQKHSPLPPKFIYFYKKKKYSALNIFLMNLNQIFCEQNPPQSNKNHFWRNCCENKSFKFKASKHWYCIKSK